MALPFMPFYWGDYWRDTAHLSDAEHVSYLRLISHYWQHGSLPTDDARLARIAGRDTVEWLQMRPVISAFFQIDWRHKRIDRDLARQTEIKESNSEKAKRAAQARWNAPSIRQAIVKQSSANANQNQNHIPEPKLDRGKVTARGTRLPPDWKPRPEDPHNEAELAKFQDYWAAVAGAKGVKLDWDATWRNWIRNSRQWVSATQPLAKPVDTFRIGHAKGVVKPEPEPPPLTEEQKAERARFVEQTLKGFGRGASTLDGSAS